MRRLNKKIIEELISSRKIWLELTRLADKYSPLTIMKKFGISKIAYNYHINPIFKENIRKRVEKRYKEHKAELKRLK